MKRFFGKVDLIAPSLGDKEVIILCSFDFDFFLNLKKKNPPARTYSKEFMEDNQTTILGA